MSVSCFFNVTPASGSVATDVLLLRLNSPIGRSPLSQFFLASGVIDDLDEPHRRHAPIGADASLTPRRNRQPVPPAGT